MTELEALSSDEALALARQGKEAWNAWAAENDGRGVDFSGVDFTTEENRVISFDEFVFPEAAVFRGVSFYAADFRNATFKGHADFSDAVFKGYEKRADYSHAVFEKRAHFSLAVFDGGASFFDATFKGYVGFSHATFEKRADFSHAVFEHVAYFLRAAFKRRASFFNATFKGDTEFFHAVFEQDASFGGGTFAGAVSFESCRFGVVPDFRRNQFAKHVTLDGVHVDFRAPKTADDGADADKYRRLKELAVAARDHDREQFFFACELKAKRGFETQGWALVPNFLYEWTSDFGRSVVLPTFWLFFTWFLFGLAYATGFGKAGMGANGLVYSAAHLLPLLPSSRFHLAALETRLFGGSETVPSVVFALATLEGALGVIFLFLMGLALRNRFRI